MIPRTGIGRPYMKGKTIAVGPYGGTPNSIMRYLLGKWKLDPKTRRDVDRGCPIPPFPAAVRGGQAVIGNSTEPMVTQGIRNGFFGASRSSTCQRSLAPYAYSTINVRLDFHPEGSRRWCVASSREW